MQALGRVFPFAAHKHFGDRGHRRLSNGHVSVFFCPDFDKWRSERGAFEIRVAGASERGLRQNSLAFQNRAFVCNNFRCDRRRAFVLPCCADIKIAGREQRKRCLQAHAAAYSFRRCRGSNEGSFSGLRKHDANRDQPDA